MLPWDRSNKWKLRDPRQLGYMAVLYDAKDPQSLIYDSSNRVSLIADKSGNSGVGSATSVGLVLNGVAGNYASSPDSAAVSVTGDIDIRVNAALNDWTPASDQTLIAKRTGAGQFSFQLDVKLTTGLLYFYVTTDGTTAVTNISSVAPTVSDSSSLWVRVTRVSASGLTTFYTSTDGASWTQLGTTVNAGLTTIFDSTAAVEIGSTLVGTANNISGRIARAQIYNGIAGTLVFDANFVGQRCNAASFVESSSNAATVTINGSALLGWVDSITTSTGLYLNGASGCYASSPSTSALNITGDIDIRAQVSLPSWTTGSYIVFVSRFGASSPARSYELRLNLSNYLELVWRTAASTTVLYTSSGAATGLAPFASKWVRATLDVDNGAGGNTAQFYLSDDGVAWTQLGVPAINIGVTDIFSSTGNLSIGLGTGGVTGQMSGQVFRAQILNGINGTVVFDANFVGQRLKAGSFIESSSNAAVVTMNGSAVLDNFTAQTNCLALNGVAGNYGSVIDSVPLSILGDMSLRAFAMLPSWSAPAAVGTLISKYNGAGQSSYLLRVNTSGFLVLTASADGTAVFSFTSSVATGFADFAAGWVRADLDVDNGASGKSATFYTSPDGSSWTQLGTVQTIATVTTIFDSTTAVNIGAWGGTGANEVLNGNIYRAQIYAGLTGTDMRLDANFGAAPKLATSFIESSSNAALVTVNTTGDTGARICGARDLVQMTVANQPILTIGASNYLTFDGTNDYLKSAAFALSQPETVYFVGSQVTWTSLDLIYDGNVTPSMLLAQRGTTPNVYIHGGSVYSTNPETGFTIGGKRVISCIFNGPASSQRVGRSIATASGNDIGAAAANGFVLGAGFDGTASSNITASEIAIYSAAHDAATQDKVALYFGNKWGILV